MKKRQAKKKRAEQDAAPVVEAVRRAFPPAFQKVLDARAAADRLSREAPERSEA